MVRTLFCPLRAWGMCIAVGALFITSCQKSIDVALPDEALIQELKSFLASSSGYGAEKVIYSPSKNIFVIDKDVEMSFDDAKKHYETAQAMPPSTGRSTQMRYSYVVSSRNAPSVKVYIQPSVPAEWISSIDEAIQNWNEAGSLLKLQRVSQSKRASVSIGTIYLANSSTVASANYPDTQGNPGKSIIINTFHNGLPASMKTFALTHELGHTFGFTHTDGYYGTLINGTPVTDPASVMNSYVQEWYNFSSYDLVAIRTIYPK